MRAMTRTVILGLLFMMASAAPARADWLLTPFAGVTFGGGATDKHFTFGGSAAWMGAGIIGFELDGGYTPEVLDDETLGLVDSNVATLMVNLIVGAPLGSPGVRPYASGGIGLIRTSIGSAGDFFEFTNNDLGVNVGAGLVGFFSDNVGLRADVRYFRSVNDEDLGTGVDLDLGSFDFWRGTVGVTFKF